MLAILLHTILSNAWVSPPAHSPWLTPAIGGPSAPLAAVAAAPSITAAPASSVPDDTNVIAAAVALAMPTPYGIFAPMPDPHAASCAAAASTLLGPGTRLASADEVEEARLSGPA
jgi:hypothetical protein